MLKSKGGQSRMAGAVDNMISLGKLIFILFNWMFNITTIVVGLFLLSSAVEVLIKMSGQKSIIFDKVMHFILSYS